MSQIPVYDSARHIHPAIDELKNVARYQYLIVQLVQRDILTRYKRSALGIAWTMLNPLGMMVILSIVFSQLFASATPAYPLYILSGLMAWNFFAQCTNASMYNMVWGGGLIHRIYIPRSTFVLSAIATALVNLTLSIIPLVLVMLVMKVPLRLTIFYLPIPMFLLACFSLGVGLILSILAIYFPDVAEMYQIVLTAWMYLTPVIYPEKIVPPALLPILRANPMYFLLNLYRLPLYDGRLPTLGEFWPAAAWAIGILVLGWFIFTSKADEFAYRV
jgi:ABC-type polysaccharide/polyol phosphate export permease